MAQNIFRRRSGVNKTTICNLALSKLGSSRVLISNIDSDNGEIPDLCNLYYNIALEELARMHSWNCCKKRSILYPYSYSFISYNYYKHDGTTYRPNENVSGEGQRRIRLVLEDVDYTGITWNKTTGNFASYNGYQTPSYSQYSRQAVKADEISVPPYFDPNLSGEGFDAFKTANDSTYVIYSIFR